jgi:hypothetical protein
VVLEKMKAEAVATPGVNANAMLDKTLAVCKGGVFSDFKTTSGTLGACPHECCCCVGTCHTVSDSPRCALPSRSHEGRVAFGHVPHGAPTESATRLLGLLQALPACASRSRRCARSCSQSATL